MRNAEFCCRTGRIPARRSQPDVRQNPAKALPSAHPPVFAAASGTACGWKQVGHPCQIFRRTGASWHPAVCGRSGRSTSSHRGRTRPSSALFALAGLLRRKAPPPPQARAARQRSIVIRARTAEIQQHRRIFPAQEDIFGHDGAVDDLPPVERRQIVQKRAHHPHQRPRRNCPVRLHPLQKRFALDVRHHHIRRAVLLEQIQQGHKRRAVRLCAQDAVSMHELRAVQGR